MPISEEKRKGQEDYAVAMAIMKEMKAEGIINKEDILFVEAKFAERFKPYWRYKEFDFDP